MKCGRVAQARADIELVDRTLGSTVAAYRVHPAPGHEVNPCVTRSRRRPDSPGGTAGRNTAKHPRATPADRCCTLL